MTSEEQVKLWVCGNPIHDTELNQCCPDFSCCKPELLAQKEEREHFAAANSNERDRMLMMFLGRALAVIAHGKKCHVAGPERAEAKEGEDQS